MKAPRDQAIRNDPVAALLDADLPGRRRRHRDRHHKRRHRCPRASSMRLANKARDAGASRLVFDSSRKLGQLADFSTFSNQVAGGRAAQSWMARSRWTRARAARRRARASATAPASLSVFDGSVGASRRPGQSLALLSHYNKHERSLEERTASGYSSSLESRLVQRLSGWPSIFSGGSNSGSVERQSMSLDRTISADNRLSCALLAHGR